MKATLKVLLKAVCAFAVILVGLFIYLTNRSFHHDPVRHARAEMIARLTNLSGALETFKKNCSRYPLTSEGLQFLVSEVTPDVCEPYKRSIYSQVPLDIWDQELKYQSDGINFKLWTTYNGEIFIVKNGVKAYLE